MTKIQNKLLRPLIQGIQMLDAPLMINGQQRTPVFNDPGRVRYNLARTLKSLKAAMEILDEAQQKLMEQYRQRQRDLDPQSDQLTGEVAAEYTVQLLRVLREPVEVDIRPVNLTDLKIEDNQTNMNAIADLLDLVVLDNRPAA